MFMGNLITDVMSKLGCKIQQTLSLMDFDEFAQNQSGGFGVKY